MGAGLGPQPVFDALQARPADHRRAPDHDRLAGAEAPRLEVVEVGGRLQVRLGVVVREGIGVVGLVVVRQRRPCWSHLIDLNPCAQGTTIRTGPPRSSGIGPPLSR